MLTLLLSRKLVVRLLALDRPGASQLPALLLHLVYPFASLSHTRALAFQRDEVAPQIRHSRRRVPVHALLVRRFHRAGGLLERSSMLWACVFGGEGSDCVRGVYLVSRHVRKGLGGDLTS